MAEARYPRDPAAAGLTLFQAWFGAHFARSAALSDAPSVDGGVLHASLLIGRKWTLAVTLLNTLALETTVEYEAARAAIEHRLDDDGRPVMLWAPPGAQLPATEPGLSELAMAVAAAKPVDDGRLEVRRPVNLYLRRTSTTGSVVTILGGLAGHWARFTNRVAGSFQMNSFELLRLPESQDERDELAERVVMAAGQPEVDDGLVLGAEDAWTANEAPAGAGSCVIGSPALENDDHSAQLRRNLRQLLRAPAPATSGGERPAARALVVLGAATYATEEKLSWALKGMDPTLYAGNEIVAVLADGALKVLMEPPRGTLPWDAPLG